jgi:hypothetical protein
VTKTVRIENADSGTSKKVVIEQFQTGPDGDRKISEQVLTNPADLATFHVHDSNWLKIREVPIETKGDA